MQSPQAQQAACDLFPVAVCLCLSPREGTHGLCLTVGSAWKKGKSARTRGVWGGSSTRRALQPGFLMEKGFLERSESSSGIQGSSLNHVLLT